MDAMQNVVVLSLRDNPNLVAAFQGKNPGDSFRLELSATVMQKTDDEVRGKIRTIAVPGFTPVNETREEMTPDADLEPVAVEIRRQKK